MVATASVSCGNFGMWTSLCLSILTLGTRRYGAEPPESVRSRQAKSSRMLVAPGKLCVNIPGVGGWFQGYK